MLRDHIKPLIPKIISRELTNRDVAQLLKTSEFSVCRVLRQLKVTRNPAPKRESKPRVIEEARKHMRETVAALTLDTAGAEQISIAEAARRANCSERTIYRYRRQSQ